MTPNSKETRMLDHLAEMARNATDAANAMSELAAEIRTLADIMRQERET